MKALAIAAVAAVIGVLAVLTAHVAVPAMQKAVATHQRALP